MAKTTNNCPIPQGILLVIGGKESKSDDAPENKEAPDGFTAEEILKKFIELTGKTHPAIEIITTSSEVSNEVFNDYKKVFTELGVKKLGHIHHKVREEVLEDQSLEKRLEAADAFFFSGGSQILLSSIYGGTLFLKKIKERYISDKIVIAGTSAGAMAMSTPMIYGGSSEVQELAGEIKVTTGLEFMKDVCIDTHFVHRGRFLRLAQVIASNPTCIGMGIEEDTAFIVREGTDIEVIGSGTIIIFEGFNISYTNIHEYGNKKPITIRDLNVHILSKEDKYTLKILNPPHY
jgi:cyanophycinase